MGCLLTCLPGCQSLQKESAALRETLAGANDVNVMSAGRTFDELSLPSLSLTKASSTSAQPPLALSEEHVRAQNGRQLGYAFSGMPAEPPHRWLGSLMTCGSVLPLQGHHAWAYPTALQILRDGIWGMCSPPGVLMRLSSLRCGWPLARCQSRALANHVAR